MFCVYSFEGGNFQIWGFQNEEKREREKLDSIELN